MLGENLRSYFYKKVDYPLSHDMYVESITESMRGLGIAVHLYYLFHYEVLDVLDDALKEFEDAG